MRPQAKPTIWDVRPETPEDFRAVREVHERAFAPRHEEANLVDALRAARAHVPELCLVALDRSSVVGHVAFSRAHLSSGSAVLALAPIGVLPEYQRRGAGSALIRGALTRAAQTEFPLVIVVGHAAYYPRFGFEPAEALGVHAPFPMPPETWLAHRLPAYRTDARGTVAYPEPFARLTA
jgi:putative acetyltransferase